MGLLTACGFAPTAPPPTPTAALPSPTAAADETAVFAPTATPEIPPTPTQPPAAEPLPLPLDESTIELSFDTQFDAPNAPPFNPGGPIPQTAAEPGRAINQEALLPLTAAQVQQLRTDRFVLTTDPVDTAAAVPYLSATRIMAYTQVVHQQALENTRATYADALLTAFTNRLYAQAFTAYQQTHISPPTDPAGMAAAQRALAYTAVPYQLLHPEAAVHPAVRATVENEVSLMRLGGGYISPYWEDVVDYTPFADAADDAARARQWYRQLSPMRPVTAVPERVTAAQTRLLLRFATAPETADLWTDLYRLHAYLDGRPADVAPAQWMALAEQAPDPDTFAATARNLPPLRLLPPAGSFTAHAFRGLTFNRVGVYTGPDPAPDTAVQTGAGPVRAIPGLLDAAVVWGVPGAEEQLRGQNGSAFEGFDAQLTALRDRFAPPARPAQYETGWLAAVSAVAQPLPDRVPVYMRGALWEAQQIDQWQIGWLAAQLDLPSPPDTPVPAGPIYVEPQPLLYAYLASATAQLQQTLADTETLTPETAAALRALTADLYALHLAARHLRHGAALTAEQQTIAHLWMAAAPRAEAQTLYTDQNSGRRLTAGLDAPTIIVLVPLNGRLVIAAGPDLRVEQ